MRMQRVRRSNRWGDHYKDNRNWPEYNEQLVVRGEFYLDLGFVRNWNRELRKMNESKRSGQYKFPELFIRWLTVWKQWLDYRGLEGVSRSLERLALIPAHSDYSTIWNRLHDMIPQIELPKEDELDVATDGSGLKTNNAGEYRVFKYREKAKKKYLVVVITADIRNKKLLKVEAHIQNKGKSEPKIAKKHLKKLKKDGKKVRKLYGDGMMDSNDLFRYLGKENILCAIKLRKNATSNRCRGNRNRRDEIRRFRKWGYRLWARYRRYGMRWAVEGIFSSVKRKFGENIVSKSGSTMQAEAVQRFWAYDTVRNYGIDRTVVSG